MGSHKKPLCVGQCTSEDLNVIFFLSMGSGGGGREWREEACPKPPPRFQEGLGDLPFVHSTSHDTWVTAIYQTLKILKQNSM